MSDHAKTIATCRNDIYDTGFPIKFTSEVSVKQRIAFFTTLEKSKVDCPSTSLLTPNISNDLHETLRHTGGKPVVKENPSSSFNVVSVKRRIDYFSNQGKPAAVDTCSFSTAHDINKDLNDDLVLRTKVNKNHSSRKRHANLFTKRHAMFIEKGNIFDLGKYSFELKVRKDSPAHIFVEESVQVEQNKSSFINIATGGKTKDDQDNRKSPGTYVNPEETKSLIAKNNPNNTIISFSTGKIKNARMCMSIYTSPRRDRECSQSNRNPIVIEADYLAMSIPKDLKVSFCDQLINSKPSTEALTCSAVDTQDFDLVLINLKQKTLRNSGCPEAENKKDNTCSTNFKGIKQQANHSAENPCQSSDRKCFERVEHSKEARVRYARDVLVGSQKFVRASQISESGSFVSVRGVRRNSSTSSNDSFLSVRGCID